jgi:hypothetical protein
VSRLVKISSASVVELQEERRMRGSEVGIGLMLSSKSQLLS